MLERAGEGLDAMRRAMGGWLAERGWGPVRTPSETILEAPGFRVLAYGGEGPAVVLVPAPIKRAYIWDLLPWRSVVRRLLEAGCRVYLVEWRDPADDRAGLAEYAALWMAACVDSVAADSGASRVVLVGHSLGGTFSAIHAALASERVAGLVLVGAPLHFAPETHVMMPLALAFARRRGRAQRVPGSVLTTLTVASAPLSVGCAAWLDRLASRGDAEAADTLRRVERWSLDEMALSGALVADCIERLFREDAFVAGRLVVDGRPALPGRVGAPVLAIADPRCALAPPAAVTPFLRAVTSGEVALWRYPGDRGVLMQHVGMLVGRSAHQDLWPRVGRWIRQRAA